MKPVQWKAADILATGATQEKAAVECGVCAFTIRRWLKRSEFHDALGKEVQKIRDATRTQFLAKLLENVPHKTAHKISREQNRA